MKNYFTPFCEILNVSDRDVIATSDGFVAKEIGFSEDEIYFGNL